MGWTSRGSATIVLSTEVEFVDVVTTSSDLRNDSAASGNGLGGFSVAVILD